MRILVACATPWELKTVKTQIKSLNFKKSLDIIYLTTGIGNYETIYSLTNYLAQNDCSEILLLNIWICWYWGFRKEEQEKYLQIWRIKNVSTGKELLVPIPFEFWKITSIYSSEKALYTPPCDEEKGYVDMEARAIEYCADKFRIPRLIIKIPYDRIGEETKNFDKQEACRKLAENLDYWQLLEKLLSL